MSNPHNDAGTRHITASAGDLPLQPIAFKPSKWDAKVWLALHAQQHFPGANPLSREEHELYTFLTKKLLQCASIAYTILEEKIAT